ncbi:hypothetical protein P775_28720 [Puniceibacterium antarcticum]|uniref:Uncharacterized protein n=1 Tax=Puniceibacterium antarcticum TaxID=1206336 RepID=A0A2G8QR32_9RHOB|nr:hypothetical protein P775_28720 [Puniceibacterium antarcticum]
MRHQTRKIVAIFVLIAGVQHCFGAHEEAFIDGGRAKSPNHLVYVNPHAQTVNLIGHLDFCLLSCPHNGAWDLKREKDRRLTDCYVGADYALRISWSFFVMLVMICVFGRPSFMLGMG